jgi:hypothetical protein
MPIDNNDNEKPKKNGLWFRNEKTGEWSPMMQVESIECTINLTDEDAAKLAEIIEPLGELEIVPREK